MKKTYLAVLLIFLLLMVCSCAKKEEQKSEEQEQQIPEFTPLNEVVEGQKDIYLITKVLDSNYWDVVVKGAKEAGEEFGCNVYFSGTYNEMDWSSQEMLLDKCVSRGADAIILAPDDSIELAPKIEDIHSQNIPIILIDTAANTDGYDICYMTDNLLAGNKAAEEMLNQFHSLGFSESEEITIGILVGSSTSQTINERLAGFYQYWIQNAPETWSIISDIQNSNGDNQLGGELIASLLDDYPNLRGLFATNNGPTKAIAKVVTDQKRQDVVLVGFDYSDEIKNLIESPDYRASTILQRQYFMSYNGVQSALELIKGFEMDVKFEDTGVVTVNHSNLLDPDVQSVIENN
ncbi:MAG: substrate-binding domain-containing protein [Eubacterium sp.]|nr:substrate-binding domain-containing protein [Eubacterium sp.]